MNSDNLFKKENGNCSNENMQLELLKVEGIDTRERVGMVEIRPSMLPFLGLCPCFESRPGENAAMTRGTLLDKIFRQKMNLIQNKKEPICPEEEGLDDADRKALEWTIDCALELKGNNYLETRENYLCLPIPGLSLMGTMDGFCEKGRFFIDMKTGQLRDYTPQMAAYALAVMKRQEAKKGKKPKSFTAHLLFSDMEKLVSREFTFTEANNIVQDIIKKTDTPQPQPCQYCEWCRHKPTCPAITKLNSQIVELLAKFDSNNTENILKEILSSPQSISNFARAWKNAEKDIASVVFDKIKELLNNDPHSIPGWVLIHVKGQEFVNSQDIIQFLDSTGANCTAEDILLSIGKKFRADDYLNLCKRINVTPNKEIIQCGSSYSQLRQKNQA